MCLVALTRDDGVFDLAGAVGSIGAGSLHPFAEFVLGEVLEVYYNPGNSYIKREVMKYARVLVGLSIASPFILVLQNFSLAIAGKRLQYCSHGLMDVWVM